MGKRKQRKGKAMLPLYSMTENEIARARAEGYEVHADEYGLRPHNNIFTDSRSVELHLRQRASWGDDFAAKALFTSFTFGAPVRMPEMMLPMPGCYLYGVAVARDQNQMVVYVPSIGAIRRCPVRFVYEDSPERVSRESGWDAEKGEDGLYYATRGAGPTLETVSAGEGIRKLAHLRAYVERIQREAVNHYNKMNGDDSNHDADT